MVEVSRRDSLTWKEVSDGSMEMLGHEWTYTQLNVILAKKHGVSAHQCHGSLR